MNIQLVSERNNLGVASLEAGDLKSALDHFSDALKHTMGDLDPRSSSHSSTSPCSVEELSQRMLSLPPDSDDFMQAKARIVRQPLKALPASIPFAYARGINLIPCSGAYSPDPLINTTIISSLIIFNLSIIYHLKGLEGGNRSSSRLNKAKSLYQKSHHLLADAGVPLCATGNPVIDMLSMALFNNLAHVSFEMRNYGESRSYFDHLIRFALTVVPSRYGDAYVGTLLDQQKSNFLLNAIILQAPKLAAAA